MSHTPDESEQEATEYAAGWDAMMRLIREGKSWSGHERNCVFLNVAGPRFADVSAASGLDFYDDARAIGLTDWDHDGDLDLWLRNRTAPRLRLMRNRLDPGPRSFVALRLRGVEVNRDGIGSRVELQLADEAAEPLVRTLHAGDGFRSQSSKWLHFGLGSGAEVTGVTVHWPGGRTERFEGVTSGGRFTLVEGSGTAKPWTPPQRRVVLPASEPPLAEPTVAGTIVLSRRLPPLTLRYRAWDATAAERIEGDGKPLLVNLWASWCGPCRKEIAAFTEHAERLRAAGLDVLALTVEGLESDEGTDPDDARRMLAEVGYPFRSGRATAEMMDRVQLLQESLFSHVPAFGVPTSLLLDDEGRVAAIYRGPVDVDRLVADLALLPLDGEALREASLPFPGRWYAPYEGAETFFSLLARQFVERSPEDALSFLQAALDDIKSRGRPTDEAERDATVQQVVQIHLARARALDSLERYPEAIGEYRRLLRLEPEHGEGLKGLGVTLSKIGRLDQAEAAFRRGLEFRPDDGELHGNLALCLHLRGRLDEALAHYREAARLSPWDARAHYSLGAALRMAGKGGESLQQLREALRLDPESLGALIDAAWLMATHPDEELRDVGQALDLARRAVALTDRRDATALDTLAAAQANAGRFAEAAATAESALGLTEGNPELAELLRTRAELYRRGQPYREAPGL